MGLGKLFDCKDRCLGVEGVKHGLDQNQVAAPIHQTLNGFEVTLDQFVKVDITISRVIDVRRDGGCPAGRPQNSCHIAGTIWRSEGHGIADRSGQTRCLDIELINQTFHAVVGHADPVGVEGVGLKDVCAGLQIGHLDGADDLRLRQAEKVIVALEVAGPVAESLAAIIRLTQPIGLDHGPHRAIKEENSLFEVRSDLLSQGGVIFCHES